MGLRRAFCLANHGLASEARSTVPAPYLFCVFCAFRLRQADSTELAECPTARQVFAAMFSVNEVPDSLTAPDLAARFIDAIRSTDHRLSDWLCLDPISRRCDGAIHVDRYRFLSRRFFNVQASRDAGSAGGRADAASAGRAVSDYSESDVSGIIAFLYWMLLRRRIQLVRSPSNSFLFIDEFPFDSV